MSTNWPPHLLAQFPLEEDTNEPSQCFKVLGGAKRRNRILADRAQHPQPAASVAPPALGATDPKAASATLMVASVALGGDRCLAAVVPDGLVNLNTLGAHMGVAVPTSCEALADPAKFNQVKSLMREAERSGASSQFLVEETRVRRLGVPADLAALMRSGAASVSANYPAGVVTFS